MDYNFSVKTIESGQRKSYGDSYYAYEVTSTSSEYIVKNFCTNVLKRSFEPSKMPDPFAGRMLEFKRITNNNEGKHWSEKKEAETYSYKTQEEYTG